MTMLEKAARAARDQRVADDRAAGLHHQNGQDEVLPIDWRQARAVLVAIREQTEYVQLIARTTPVSCETGASGDYVVNPETLWQATIDAILREKP